MLRMLFSLLSLKRNPKPQAEDPLLAEEELAGLVQVIESHLGARGHVHEVRARKEQGHISVSFHYIPERRGKIDDLRRRLSERGIHAHTIEACSPKCPMLSGNGRFLLGVDMPEGFRYKEKADMRSEETLYLKSQSG